MGLNSIMLPFLSLSPPPPITCNDTTTALECDFTCLLSLELTVCESCCKAAMSELSFDKSCLIDWVRSCISEAGSPNKLRPLATKGNEIKMSQFPRE